MKTPFRRRERAGVIGVLMVKLKGQRVEVSVSRCRAAERTNARCNARQATQTNKSARTLHQSADFAEVIELFLHVDCVVC